MIGAITLQEFVVARQVEFAGATGDLSRLLTDIGTAAKMVNRHVNRAGLSGILHLSPMAIPPPTFKAKPNRSSTCMPMIRFIGYCGPV